MRTPRPTRRVIRIVVCSPRGSAARLTSAPLSEAEAWAIAQAVGPHFAHYAEQYDTKKYWPGVYARIRKEFHRPAHIAPRTLREALLWKYGHLGKPAIPRGHERLIAQLQRGWQAAATALPTVPGEAFLALDRAFGGKTRFITVAFLVHLLHQRSVPIIDQHNFRAVNALMAGVRPGWQSRKKPSRYADLALVASFIAAVLAAWNKRAPHSAPSARDLDKFLMMYGKAIKGGV